MLPNTDSIHDGAMPISPEGAAGMAQAVKSLSEGYKANGYGSPAANPETVEQEIQRKGLNAPRVKPADIDAAILREQFHVFTGSCLTVCCLTLQNGFTVTGESACASPQNFDAAVGERVSRDNAKAKIWPLLGYALKQKLYVKELLERNACGGHDANGSPVEDELSKDLIEAARDAQGG